MTQNIRQNIRKRFESLFNNDSVDWMDQPPLWLATREIAPAGIFICQLHARSHIAAVLRIFVSCTLWGKHCKERQAATWFRLKLTFQLQTLLHAGASAVNFNYFLFSSVKPNKLTEL